MISVFWVILIGVISGSLGLLTAAICFASGRADDRIKKMQEITEAKEEIIQVAIDHAYIEDSRSAGDYDINIDKEGEERIRKILEGMV